MIFIFEKRQVYGGRGVGGWGCLPVMIKDNNCIGGQAMVIFVHSGNMEYANCLNYHDVPCLFVEGRVLNRFVSPSLDPEN